MRLAYRAEDSFLIQRTYGTKIKHVRFNVVFAGEDFSCLERYESRTAVGDQRDIGAFPFEISQADRDKIFFLRYFVLVLRRVGCFP